MVPTFFEVVTGLKVNMSKSEMILVGVVGNMTDIANIFSCRIGSLSVTYFGMLSVWNSILEKLDSRLSFVWLEVMKGSYRDGMFVSLKP